MKKIIQFPSVHAREKADFEKLANQILSETPVTQEQKNDITALLYDICNKHKFEKAPSFTIPFPASLKEEDRNAIVSSISVGLESFLHDINNHLRMLEQEDIAIRLGLYMESIS